MDVIGLWFFSFCLCLSDIFSLGFGPFRWVCTSGDPQDLAATDNIAANVLEQISASVNDRIRQQYSDNIRWIKEAGKHKMVSLQRTMQSACQIYSKSGGLHTCKLNVYSMSMMWMIA